MRLTRAGDAFHLAWDEPDWLGPMRAVEHWIAEHHGIWQRRLDLLDEVLDNAFPTTKGHRSK